MKIAPNTFNPVLGLSLAVIAGFVARKARCHWVCGCQCCMGRVAKKQGRKPAGRNGKGERIMVVKLRAAGQRYLQLSMVKLLITKGTENITV